MTTNGSNTNAAKVACPVCDELTVRRDGWHRCSTCGRQYWGGVVQETLFALPSARAPLAEPTMSARQLDELRRTGALAKLDQRRGGPLPR